MVFSVPYLQHRQCVSVDSSLLSNHGFLSGPIPWPFPLLCALRRTEDRPLSADAQEPGMSNSFLDGLSGDLGLTVLAHPWTTSSSMGFFEGHKGDEEAYSPRYASRMLDPIP